MKKDGGPAFPRSVRRSENYMDEGGYGRCRTVTVDEGGMSLRQWYAGQAIQVVNENFAPKEGESDADWASWLARVAYMVADAMLREDILLAEREKEA